MTYEINDKGCLLINGERHRVSTQRRRVGIYPFRFLALFLAIGILVEMIAILRLPDYSDEREKAKHDYLIAQAENIRLQAEIDKANQINNIESAARKQGFVYYGETIYIPVISHNSENMSEHEP